MANPMPNYVVDEVYLAFSWPLVQEILTVDSVQDTTSDFGNKMRDGTQSSVSLSSCFYGLLQFWCSYLQLYSKQENDAINSFNFSVYFRQEVAS